jgi:hypothetical protein
MSTTDADVADEERPRGRGRTYLLVILVEIATVAALWLFSHHFS